MTGYERSRATGGLFCGRSDNLARAGMHQVQALAGVTGDCLVSLIVRVNLFGPPNLHMLAGVRAEKEECAHAGRLHPPDHDDHGNAQEDRQESKTINCPIRKKFVPHSRRSSERTRLTALRQIKIIIACCEAKAHALDEKLAKRVPRKMIGRTLTMDEAAALLDRLF